MRSVQRGISALFLVIAMLVIAVAFAAGYYVFSQNLKEKVASINSFEECAKHYPVMESYPEQCNTPDGKHFTRELSEEEKRDRLVPPTLPSPSASTSETANWKTYKTGDLSFSYPGDWTINTSSESPAHMLSLQSTDYSPTKELGNQKQQGISMSLFKGQVPWETGKKIGEQLGPKSIEKTTWAGEEALLEEYDYEGQHLVLTTKFNNINYQLVTSYIEGRDKLQDKNTFLRIAKTFKFLQ